MRVFVSKLVGVQHDAARALLASLEIELIGVDVGGAADRRREQHSKPRRVPLAATDLQKGSARCGRGIQSKRPVKGGAGGEHPQPVVQQNKGGCRRLDDRQRQAGRKGRRGVGHDVALRRTGGSRGGSLPGGNFYITFDRELTQEIANFGKIARKRGTVFILPRSSIWPGWRSFWQTGAHGSAAREKR